MRFLKALVMFFAVLLVAAALFLVYAGTTRMGKSGFDLATLPVPEYCDVAQTTVDEDRLILTITGIAPDCRRVLIADMKTGRLIGQFELKGAP
ncbi:hypothetical protein [Dongia rigui]|uniref:Uncharacterized protein n=1 Tax=Dongia rigui TaxID=940149 RepID=A0ABU5DUS6_9PROT|nr:hypothetical protein [Dongia rigui]MDY0870361.1 hypothetical protein [Dongia rigui]